MMEELSPTVISSQEKKHYNRAIRELYQIIKLDSRKLELSQSLLEQNESDHLGADAAPEHRRGRHGNSGRRGSSDPVAVGSSSENLFLEDDTPSTRLPVSTQSHHTQSFGGDGHEQPSSAMPENIRMVYEELASISEKLKREHAALMDHELLVDEKLQLLQAEEEARESDLDKSMKNMEAHCQRQIEEVELGHQSKLRELQETLNEKGKENRRLKESFNTLKNVNDSLRKQLDEICSKNKRLETQAVSVQHRLSNLQRKQGLSERQRAADQLTEQLKAQQAQGVRAGMQNGKLGRTPAGPRLDQGVFDILGILLEWISDVHLKGLQPGAPSLELSQERCLKILPLLVDILHSFPPSSAKHQLPYLQFILWAMTLPPQHQTVSLVSTFRRLGEELYRTPTTAVRSKVNQDLDERSKGGMYFKSSNLHVRFLSSLIILRTLSQVDHLANVFDVLRADLKEDRAKELYLTYRATPIILPYLKSSNITILMGAVDIYLQMSMESVYLMKFLETCCYDGWFHTCSALLKSPSIDTKILEKLSILLQKLSKMRATRRLFEVSQLSKQIQEMSRAGLCQDNAFLSLNLKSILFNLNMTKNVNSP